MDMKQEEWESLVGKFILSFAAIEHNSYQIMYMLLKDSIFDDLKDLGLQKRLEISLKLVEETDVLDHEWKERFTTNLKKAKSNIVHRNLIAHNPMFVDMFHCETTDGFKIIPKIMSVKKQSKFILLDDLKKLVDDMKEITIQLSACMSMLSGSLPCDVEP
jgi:hypothetical protein